MYQTVVFAASDEGGRLATALGETVGRVADVHDGMAFVHPNPDRFDTTETEGGRPGVRTSNPLVDAITAPVVRWPLPPLRARVLRARNHRPTRGISRRRGEPDGGGPYLLSHLRRVENRRDRALARSFGVIGAAGPDGLKTDRQCHETNQRSRTKSYQRIPASSAPSVGVRSRPRSRTTC